MLNPSKIVVLIGSIEEKQEYLRTNILENGYDADEFLSRR